MSRKLRFPIRYTKLVVEASVKAHVLERRTPFQRVDIYDTDVFGRMLLLDGHVQLAMFDEFAYHEALVHIPLLSLHHPKSALVIGGGDGGVLRELCKHDTLEEIVMVEIDREVADICREHMPALSQSAFDDPRVQVYYEDAFPYVKQVRGEFDLVVVDSTDTYEDEEGELSEMLFTQEFYADLAKTLRPHGIVVTQADNLVFCPDSTRATHDLFSSVFPTTGVYQALVPSFGGYSGYCWGSNGTTLASTLPHAAAKLKLSYLNETTYALAMMALPFGG